MHTILIARSGILYLVSIIFLEKLQLLSATVEIVYLKPITLFVTFATSFAKHSIMLALYKPCAFSVINSFQTLIQLKTCTCFRVRWKRNMPYIQNMEFTYST